MPDQVTPEGADVIDMSYIHNKLMVIQTPGDGPGKSYSRLPTYDGDFRDWITFRDSFTTLLNKWPNLSDINKIY